tara:strand:+ start:148 stop:516 length:369 start_codon:yes stop_codon:yes gene_type:complete
MKNNDKNKPITRSQTKKLNKKSKKINKKNKNRDICKKGSGNGDNDDDDEIEYELIDIEETDDNDENDEDNTDTTIKDKLEKLFSDNNNIIVFNKGLGGSLEDNNTFENDEDFEKIHKRIKKK